MRYVWNSKLNIAVYCCVIVLFCGCGTPGEQDNVRRDVVLEHFFETKAIDGEEGKRGLGSVPLRFADIGFRGGISIGNDFGMQIVSLFLGQGLGRKVLLSDPEVSDLLIFHEYMHQAQYSEFVSSELFRERFDRLLIDPEYAPIPGQLQNMVIFDYLSDPGFAIALIYNDGLDREMIAFVIEGWARGDYPLPDYMLDVYRGAVKLDNLRKAYLEGILIPT